MNSKKVILLAVGITFCFDRYLFFLIGSQNMGFQLKNFSVILGI